MKKLSLTLLIILGAAIAVLIVGALLPMLAPLLLYGAQPPEMYLSPNASTQPPTTIGTAPPGQGNWQSVAFTVNVPPNTPENDKIYLIVKGFDSYFTDNSTCYSLEKVGCSRTLLNKTDRYTWKGQIWLKQGALVKYSYDRGSHVDEKFINDYSRGSVERFDDDTSIYYRYLYVSSSVVSTEDTVASWDDFSYSPTTGIIRGKVRDKTNKTPLVDITVSVAGLHIGTSYDGSFEFTVPTGKQTMTISTETGEYKYASKVVEVKGNETTLVNFELEPGRKVNVVFNVAVPNYTPEFANVRLSGSIYQLGSAGWYRNSLHNSPLRFMTMNKTGASSFSISLDLYVGTYVEYIYHLARPSTNAEVDERGTIISRSFIVPSEDTVINDEVPQWSRGISSSGQRIGPTSATFFVTLPENTPENEPVLFEGGPHTQMYRVSKNLSALTLFESLPRGYRYAKGIAAPPRGLEKFEPDNVSYYRESPSAPEGQQVIIRDAINQWRWSAGKPQYIFSLESVEKRKFYSGVGLLDWYDPDYLPLYISTLDHIKKKNISWVAVYSDWQYSSLEEPKLEQRSVKIPQYTTPVQDLKVIVNNAHSRGLKLVLYTAMISENTHGPSIFSPHSNEWYDAWFEEFEKFMLFHAAVAEKLGIEMMVIPRISMFQFEDPTHETIFNEKMKQVIARTRQVYSGLLVSEEDYVVPMKFDFVNALDYLGAVWAEPLLLAPEPSATQIEEKIGELLDRNYKPAFERYNKPIIFTQVHYASVDGIASGETRNIAEHDKDDASLALDLEEQARVYDGFMRAVAKRPWIAGVFPFSYNLIEQPGTKSLDIRAKPAEDVFVAYAQAISN